MWAPQPKYWLWMRSGATIRSISSRVLVCSQVGMTPSVSPLCGSVSKSGIGMKGDVAGSSQRARPDGGGAAAAAGAAGPGAGSCARAPYAPVSNASAQAAVHRPGPLRHGTVVIAPAGAPVVDVLDDIELDLVLPGIVCPQQQIPGRRRDLVAAGKQRLQPRGLVKGVARRSCTGPPARAVYRKLG